MTPILDQDNLVILGGFKVAFQTVPQIGSGHSFDVQSGCSHVPCLVSNVQFIDLSVRLKHSAVKGNIAFSLAVLPALKCSSSAPSACFPGGGPASGSEHVAVDSVLIGDPAWPPMPGRPWRPFQTQSVLPDRRISSGTNLSPRETWYFPPLDSSATAKSCAW